MNMHSITWQIAAISMFALLISVTGCQSTAVEPADTDSLRTLQTEPSGEEVLIAALDDINAITDWGVSDAHSLSKSISISLPEAGALLNSLTDTTIMYGQLSPDGYGCVVTEKYGHPKGLLLITVKRTHGTVSGSVATETKKYASLESYRNDRPQDWNRVEVYGATADTIMTHVERNGLIETYRFQLPVVTRAVNPIDGSVRITTRFAHQGMIVSEITDEHGGLIQTRESGGWADGSIFSRTVYADLSWRTVRTLGQADGSILREITSGY